LSVQTLSEHFAVLVDVVHDVIGVLLLSGCEDNNFEVGSQLLQAVDEVRSESDINFGAQIIEVEGLLEFRWNVTFEFSSDKGLIHIKNKQLFASRSGSKINRFQ